MCILAMLVQRYYAMYFNIVSIPEVLLISIPAFYASTLITLTTVFTVLTVYDVTHRVE